MDRSFKNFTRKEFYSLVWSKPATKLAKELGIADGTITKICRRHKIPKPWPGYWNELNRVIPPLRSVKGVRDQILIRKRSGVNLRPEALELIKKAKLVAEDLEVSKNLSSADASTIKAKELLESARSDEYGRLKVLSVDGNRPEILDLRVSRAALNRALRFIDTLLLAFKKLGFPILVGSGTGVVIGGQEVWFYIWERVERHKRSEAERSKTRSNVRWTFLPTDKLIFEINSGWVERKRWKDKGERPIETRINEIIRGLITASEIIRQQREARSSHLSQQARAEQGRKESMLLRELEAERLKELERNLDLRTRCDQITKLVKGCEYSCLKELSNNPALNEWLEWIREQAASMHHLREEEMQMLIVSFRKHANRP